MLNLTLLQIHSVKIKLWKLKSAGGERLGSLSMHVS